MPDIPRRDVMSGHVCQKSYRNASASVLSCSMSIRAIASHFGGTEEVAYTAIGPLSKLPFLTLTAVVPFMIG